MDIRMFTYPLGILLIIAMAVGLGIYLANKFRLGGRLYLIGGVTFILSQVGHIPFNGAVTALFSNGVLPAPPESSKLVFNAVFLGLSAGLFEEWARYLVLKLWAKDARSWGQGLLFGAGHGGVEALIVAGLAGFSFLTMVGLRGTDLSAMLPPEQIGPIQEAIDLYWGSPWYESLLPAVERFIALTTHIAMALLVMQAVLSGKTRWVWASILLHTLLNFVAVYLSGTTNNTITEAALLLFVPVDLAIIFALRRIQPYLPPQQPDAPHGVPASLFPIQEVEETQENLDQTRYS